jgi:cytochrome c oxidase subunit I+III
MGYVAMHAFVAMVFAAYGIWRHRAGYLSPVRSLDVRLARIWTDYTAVTGLAALGAFLLLSFVIGAPR